MKKLGENLAELSFLLKMSENCIFNRKILRKAIDK